jgi:3-deoxy-D-manno-octulosonate 8-phosphate phosphatase (KDO 8-P phosphatase)
MGLISLSEPLKQKLRPVRVVLFDVDGILTNCQVFLDSNGEWRRFFSIRDGYGMKLLMDQGYQVGLITASKAKDIQERAKLLGLSYIFEGSLDKISVFNQLAETEKISPLEVAYMGDDLFDLPVLKAVGFSATVKDAVPEVLKEVDYIAERPGGFGAARELCDLVRYYGAFSGAHSQGV